MILEGKIVRKITGYYFVYTGYSFKTLSEFEDNLLLCKLKGSLKNKNKKDNCVVGDNVLIDDTSNSIIEIKERKNIIYRPLISNIDYLAITLSIKNPDFNFNTLQKMLLKVHENNIDPILILTKCDLAKKEEIENLNTILKVNFPYLKVFNISKENELENSNFKTFIKDKSLILTGLSGVGKSSLINKLLNFDIIRTSEVSKKTKKGKNTTVDTRFYPLENGYIIDTPGFSSFEISSFKNELDIKYCFPEILELSKECKFKNCIHLNEPNCNVKDNLNQIRYDFYKYILNNWRKK